MSRKILTFGYDACHRWAVLRLAGFTVHACESIGELRDRLMRRSQVDAVIMVEDIVSVPQEAITAAKSYFHGPLVLFQARTRSAHKEAFDLCVPILSGPSVWLPKLETLLDSSRVNSEAEIPAQRIAKMPVR
ncbi:MAG: hypothetical protein JST28_18480 [Acidobacteria bacterium]|nr:hypothetical protein [Acidobacteriota bacterium]